MPERVAIETFKPEFLPSSGVGLLVGDLELLDVVGIDAEHVIDRRGVRRLVRLDAVDGHVARLRPHAFDVDGGAATLTTVSFDTTLPSVALLVLLLVLSRSTAASTFTTCRMSPSSSVTGKAGAYLPGGQVSPTQIEGNPSDSLPLLKFENRILQQGLRPLRGRKRWKDATTA